MKPAELDLYPSWQSFCHSQRLTQCGRLRGEFAGEMNLSEGPDFLGAVFSLDGLRSSGDVEVHLHRKDWYHHGHHLDSRYDNVILHLVWSKNPDELNPVQNSKGRLITAFSIQRFPPVFVMQNRVADCSGRGGDHGEFIANLNDIITQRLIGLGRQLYRRAAVRSTDQALYAEICSILGSPQNRTNFLWLAKQLPWETIQYYQHRFNLSFHDWFALFLNMSGLIGSRREFVDLLPRLRKLNFISRSRQMSRQMWKLAGQRPSHNPINRLAGLALFITHCQTNSLHHQIDTLFSHRFEYAELRKKFRVLCQPEKIPADLYTYIPNQQNRQPWGEDLLTEVIGNVIIPFLYLRARQGASSGFCDYLKSIYMSISLTTPYACNRIFLRWREFDPPFFRLFFVQQALLQLRHYFCLMDRCDFCPLRRMPIKR